MELVLNLFWFVLALAALAFFVRNRWRSRRHPQSRYESLHGLIALSCALSILLPVISVTDDLHSTEATFEDSNSSRKILKRWAGSARSAIPPRSFAPPASLILPRCFCLDIRILRRIAATEVPSSKSASLHPVKGRAPPLFFPQPV